ncbi:carbohydrate-binding protein [Microbacterium sp. JZ37]|uniref:carbohydrate-binding protein n=1 Tax=Microbacterium sp. JZ37 TaxID=2654193 RepID=UPI002B493945|nr:carbohydrate-binding protein [Microbacterium sp. JZ37]
MKRTLGAATTLAAAALVTSGFAAPPAVAADAERLTVDFSDRTGEFRGGASGTLYGFGDDGAPTQALINGAHITNTSQKPPYGTQHPGGDTLKIEDGFFDKHGEDLYIYQQDYYPEWPYNSGVRPGDDRTYDVATGSYTEGGNGVWDYLEVIEFVTEAVATQSDHPEEYTFIPFNEPDWIWYSDWAADKEQFFADWTAVHEKIEEVYARHGLDRPRIGGPGDSHWRKTPSTEFLDYAIADGSVPDVWIWHELGIDNLATYRGHLAEFRAIESSKGIDPIPVNITEYGMLRDMGQPGQLIQWFSMFEDTKVDAQTAYWGYSGNFSDNSSRPNGANAGWWMFKWYGDLEGSETVRVTPPRPDTADTLQGIAAVDDENRRATVLLGGTDADVEVSLEGLDRKVFGNRVDVEVREIATVGAQGLADTPALVWAADGAALAGGKLTIPVDTFNRYAAYQVLITPAGTHDVEQDLAAQPWSATVEAESTAITGSYVQSHDPKASGGWTWLASGNQDVRAFKTLDSTATWTVEVPRDGLYRLQAIGASNKNPGQHALWVDGAYAGTVQYRADLHWNYRGSGETLVELTAGTHELTLRTTADGENLLPYPDVTLDRFLLTDVTDGEPTVHPASTFRLYDGAKIAYQGKKASGFASLSDSGRADLYVTAMDSGYYDLSVAYESGRAGAIEVTINGGSPVELASDRKGSWESTARVHLAEGINEIELRSSGDVAIESVTTTRVRAADDARVVLEAEDGQLTGTAQAGTLAPATGTNATGGGYVDGLGGGEGNAIEFARSAGFDSAGDYAVSVWYSNASLASPHPYNPQVVDLRLDIAEGDQEVGYGYHRHTFSWNSFLERSMQVTLSSDGEPLRVFSADGEAPRVDKLIVAPMVLGSPTTQPVG